MPKREAMHGYGRPSYPRRDEVDDATLGRYMPRRWRRSGRVAGAMALLFFQPPAGMATARADSAVPPARGGPAATPAPGPGDDSKRRNPDGSTPPRAVRVVDVFEHGEGRGAFGCVAVAPPAFLSEQDARQVILEEFARAGVRFRLDARQHPTLRERKVTLTAHKNAEGRFVSERKLVMGKPITLDGWDPEHQIGFEYVSEADYFALGGAESMSSVQEYDFKGVARQLAAEAKDDASMRLGVFYDPMAPVQWEEDPDGGYREPRNVRGQAELRAQVRDFVAWLRQAGVLPAAPSEPPPAPGARLDGGSGGGSSAAPGAGPDGGVGR